MSGHLECARCTGWWKDAGGQLVPAEIEPAVTVLEGNALCRRHLELVPRDIESEPVAGDTQEAHE